MDLNQEARDQEIRTRLLDAGIGKRYHNKSLNDCGAAGKRLIGWLNDGTFTVDLVTGRPVLIYGPNSYETTLLLARAICLRRIPLQVYFLPKIRQDGTPEGLEYFDTEVVGVVTHFYNSAFGASPLPSYFGYEVEDAIHAKLDSAEMIILQATDSLEDCTWWSSELRTRLKACGLLEVRAAL